MAERRHRLFHILRSHDHDHGVRHQGDADRSEEGMRATLVSLGGLGVTTIFQAILLLFTGSVALLSDTIHNLLDALTAIPLWIAFSLGRKGANDRFSHGYHRAEDLAGLVIVVAIGASAVAVIWESARRVAEPRELHHIPWVIAAGVIGALGNEFVARYRMHAGRRIGSEALIADGYHARTDAFTSLAVVVAGVGAAFGWNWVDPVAGLGVGVLILRVLVRTARPILGRLVDAVDPEMTSRARAVAASVDGVHGISGLRLRWHGNRIVTSLSIEVDPEISVAEGHTIAEEVQHDLMHAFEVPLTAVVHVDPHGPTAPHSRTLHHRAG
jgi:cation diffusion facilitator family transporter